MRLKILFSICFGLILLLATNINIARADGGILPRPHFYTNETNQKAFIYYQNQTENLVIQASYQGNTSDFVWIVPTPNQPEINKSDAQLFATLENLTQIPGSVEPMPYRTFSSLGAGASKSVTVIAEKTVDIYDTTVIQATDSQALVKWLNDHNYAFPTDQATMLQSYVDNHWYFSIAKIQDGLASNVDLKNQLSTGTIAPLRFTFKSNTIIYPMKLTRIALDYANTQANTAPPAINNLPAPNTATNYYASPIGVTLYILTDHKVTQDQMSTDWANWLITKNIDSLNQTVTGDNYLPTDQKLFLTKLTGAEVNKNTDNDLIFLAASNNDIYPVPVLSDPGFWLANFIIMFLIILIAIFEPFGLIFIVLAILQRFAIKKRWLYILFNAYEIMFCLGILSIGISIYFLAGSPFSEFIKQTGMIGVELGLLVSLAIATTFTVIMIRYSKSTHLE